MTLRFPLLLVGTLLLLSLLAPSASAAQFTIHPNQLFAGWSVHPSSGSARVVSSEWTMPAVSCDALVGSESWFKSRAAVWIGIWGHKYNDPATTWLAQIGTVSQCKNGGQSYTAVAQLFHLSETGGYRTPEPYTIPVNIQPGDIIFTQIDYYGRQPDNKLKYEATIATQRNNFQTHYQRILMVTDPDVRESDAAWQGGFIVESQPDKNFLDVPPGGGLANFTTPIQFTPFCDVNAKTLDTYSGSRLAGI